MKLLVQCAVLLVAATAASTYNLGYQDIIFHLFTRNNPAQSQPLLPTVNSIAVSSFSRTAKTIITIHDFDETSNGNANAFLAPAFLAKDVNYIAVDWSKGAGLYAFGLGNAPQVGEVIASFINILSNTFGYEPSNIEIVGVGVGAHIAGIAARQAVSSIYRIIALNPSLHGWTHHPDKLKAVDADSVEVLHTTAGSTGYDLPLGDIDFYANGGASQPGCTTSDCSHIYGYVYFAESINSEITNGPKFIGTACDSYEQAAALQCTGERDAVFGGTEEKETKEGVYLFFTNLIPPFAAN